MNKIERLDQKRMDKTLDDILNYLKSTIFIKDQKHIQYLFAVDIFFKCYGEKQTQLHNYTEPELFLEKLYNDGFVNFKDDAYQINLEGIEFINNGGYRIRTRNKCQIKIWNVTKIIAVFVNAIILIIFGFSSFKKDQVEVKKGMEKVSVSKKE